MTKKTIEKLPESAREKLECYKEIRNRIDKRNEKAIKEYKDTTRGFITALLTLGIITREEFRVLYIYYATM